MAEVLIDGKTVVLRDSLPARQFYALAGAVQQIYPIGKAPFDEVVPPLVSIVERWELDGNPADIEAWAQLDLFRHLWPLLEAIWGHVRGIIRASGERAKN
jgi:hypothetical protein